MLWKVDVDSNKSSKNLNKLNMKQVLIAIDDKPTAQRVADAGHLLAKAINGHAILLHVIADTPYYSSLDYSPVMGFEGFTTAVEKLSHEDFEKVAHQYLYKIKRKLGDEEITTVVKHGNFAHTILKFANELKVDMIVMGSNGKHGLEKFLAGSVAQKVLQHSAVPVLIIPTKAEDFQLSPQDNKSS